MKPEKRVAGGTPIHQALAAFRESLNQTETLHASGYPLLLNLDHLEQLLSEPITQEEASVARCHIQAPLDGRIDPVVK